MATLLAAWGATQRVAGFRGHAVSAISRALRLAQRSRDVWAQGFCLQKAAYLAHDLGRDVEGLAFVRMAALCFLEDGDADDHARVTVDRGYFAYYCGRHEEAERLFRAGLAKLAQRHSSFRRAAHFGLSAIAAARQELELAANHLEEAAQACEETSLELAHIRWGQGRSCSAAGRIEEAKRHFQESIGIFGERGQAADIALVAIDYAEALLSHCQAKEFAALATAILRWLPPLADYVVIRPAIENLVALLKLGYVTTWDLNKARRALDKAGIVQRAF